jgi:hypothetical protein
MPKYRVHIYREMRLVFENVEAETPEAAAHIAADRHFDDCDDWSDCEGVTLSALVDLDSAIEESAAQDGVLVDFEDRRLLNTSRKLLTALSAILPEIDAEIEQRQHGGNDEDWAALQRLSDEAHATVREANGTTLQITDEILRTVGSSHGQLTIDAAGNVVNRNIDNAESDGGHLAAITRFDLGEWKRHWGSPLPESFDILDLGYWYADPGTAMTAYEPPVAEWRKDIAEILLERKRSQVADACCATELQPTIK